MDKSLSFIKHLLWPPVDTQHAARVARMAALGLSVLAASLWTIIAILGLFSPGIYGSWPLVYAILFSLISWGLYHMRREAASAGFAVSLLGLILLDWTSIWAIIQSFAFLVSYLQAIRGTFANSASLKISN